jgi:signal peptidase I
VAVCLVSCVVGFVLTFKVYSIPSGSMENTLRPGDRIWVEQGQDVRRGDIVVYDIPSDSGAQFSPGTYVKRLIGLRATTSPAATRRRRHRQREGAARAGLPLPG